MRVLHVNKFAYRKGGAEVYLADLAAAQVQQGHSVGVFGGKLRPEDFDGSVSTYDTEIDDFHDATSAGEKLSAARSVLWNARAARSLDRAIHDFCPDVVHLHNYAHQLSSSIIPVLRRAGVPSVHTAHDYKLICPAYVANVGGHDCFACKVKIGAKPLMTKCHQNSASWTAIAVAEAAVVRAKVLVPDVVIAPSTFMQHQLQTSWIANSARIELALNPATWDGLEWIGGGAYLLYVGRLSREKGLNRLIEACSEVGFKLILAGVGPIERELRALAAALGADTEFAGHVTGVELAALRQSCRAQIVPSAWPENAPLSALEAAASGVPVVATSRGGLPEFASRGARIAYMAETNSRELSAALAQLHITPGDPERFRAESNWAVHADRVAEIYAGIGSVR